MIVNGERVDRLAIEGNNGVRIQVSDTEEGNLRVQEIGQYIKNLHVIPQSSNCVVISSTTARY